MASPASFNNEIGVPLTILAADARTEVLVVELGTNAPGEIAALARLARPTIGIVTNVGASHLEGLGSLEGVAREKAALYAELPDDGLAVLNLDGRFADELRDSIRCEAITYSVAGGGDFDARAPLFLRGGTTFRLGAREVSSPLLGIHNIHNLLAGLAACHGLGVELDELLPAIARLSGGRGRMERRELGELTLFDDTYNANPDSVRAALRVLSSYEAQRRVLILGDMLELGERAPEEHHALGGDVARSGIELLALVGELTRATAAGALEAGMDPERVVHLGSPAEAAERVSGLVGERDVVLVKGSRRLGLESLVERIAADHASRPNLDRPDLDRPDHDRPDHDRPDHESGGEA